MLNFLTHFLALLSGKPISQSEQCVKILGGICVSGAQCDQMGGIAVHEMCPEKFTCCLAKNTEACMAQKGTCLFVFDEKSAMCNLETFEFRDNLCGTGNNAKCCVPKPPITLLIGIFVVCTAILVSSIIGGCIYKKRGVLCFWAGVRVNNDLRESGSSGLIAIF